MRELVDLLTKQLQSTMPVVTESNDTDGHPVVTYSEDATPATTEKIVVIRIKPIDQPLSQDILGNTSFKYSNHVIQVCTEANPAGGSGGDILTPFELLPIMVECGRKGSFVEWYESAEGDIPAVAEMTAANLGATWKDLYWNIQKAI